jgi:ribonuclease BN (tRNA processing enzyme)
LRNIVKIKFLGVHNVEAGLVKLPGVLVDNVLALDAGCLSLLSTPEQLGLKAILLTHQHYDHLRDLPILGMNLYLNNARVRVFGPLEVQSILVEHFLNGAVYSRFLERSTINYHPVAPGEWFSTDGYDILPVTVRHSVPAIGYEISAGGHRLFYSGDTGPGLSCAWEHLRPDVIIIEVTAPNRWAEHGHTTGHLTPALLKKELADFLELKGYLPPIYAVHMNPFVEDELRAELAEVAHTLNCLITPAHEGLEIDI